MSHLRKICNGQWGCEKKVEFLIATETLELQSSQILKRTRFNFVRIAIWSTFEKCAACQCVCANSPICSSPLKPSNFKTHRFSKGKVWISCALTYGPPSRNMQFASEPVEIRRMCAWPWNPSNCEPLKFWNRRVEIVWALALGPPSKNMEQASGVSRFRRFLAWEGVAVSERYHFPETESKEFDRRLFRSGTQKFPDSVVAKTIFSRFLPCTELVDIYVVCQSPPPGIGNVPGNIHPLPPRNINYLSGYFKPLQAIFKLFLASFQHVLCRS